MFSCTEPDNPVDSAIETPSPYPYDWRKHIPFTTSYATFSMPTTTLYNPIPVNKGEVNLSEASGLAYSRSNPGKVWAHNDSGHPNTIFLIDTATGQIVASYSVTGAVNIDWEDMEIAPGPINGRHYLYIGDTGDNNEKRPDYTIFRFLEPTYDSAAHYGKLTNLGQIDLDRIRFRYPDGSHDTEAVFVDPFTKDIYLATKRDVVSMLYVIPYPQNVSDVYTIYKAGNFSFRESSAGTVSEDGKFIMIKNRQEIFFWSRDTSEALYITLSKTPIKAPYAGEPQGEAICFDPLYNYFTLSEELNSQIRPSLYKYYFNL